MRILLVLLAALLLNGALSACSPATAVTATVVAPSPSPAVLAVPDPVAVAVPANLPLVTVHKNPTCGCCQSWVEHLRQAGFPVRVVEADDLTRFRQQAGVPAAMASCHTAEVNGYFIEGHVPAQDIVRLITEHPAARGLAVPGMPQGAPGMGDTSAKHPAYTVYLVALDNNASEFSQH